MLCNSFEMVNNLPPLLRQRCVLSKLSSVSDSCWADIGQFLLGKNNPFLAILYGSRTQAPALNNILEKCSTFWRGGGGSETILFKQKEQQRAEESKGTSMDHCKLENLQLVNQFKIVDRLSKYYKAH